VLSIQLETLPRPDRSWNRRENILGCSGKTGLRKKSHAIVWRPAGAASAVGSQHTVQTLAAVFGLQATVLIAKTPTLRLPKFDQASSRRTRALNHRRPGYVQQSREEMECCSQLLGRALTNGQRLLNEQPGVLEVGSDIQGKEWTTRQRPIDRFGAHSVIIEV